ncbi:MAG: hypothetical protein WCI79_02060 [Candidatus Saccharibacteria bacterium]
MNASEVARGTLTDVNKVWKVGELWDAYQAAPEGSIEKQYYAKMIDKAFEKSLILQLLEEHKIATGEKMTVTDFAVFLDYVPKFSKAYERITEFLRNVTERIMRQAKDREELKEIVESIKSLRKYKIRGNWYYGPKYGKPIVSLDRSLSIELNPDLKRIYDGKMKYLPK